MNLAYIEIIVTNRAGVQKSLLSSSAGAWPLINAEFDLLRDGGCGDFSMIVQRDRMPGTIALGDLLTVRALLAPAGSVLTTYWKGVITSIPKSNNVDRKWRYEARGLWDAEVANQRIVKYYASADVDDLVASILADIDTPVTALSTSTSEISVASPYNLADFEAEFDSATDAIAQLALLQNNVQYGVDQNGKLYFKDLLTSDVEHYWIGADIERFDPREDTDSIVNDVYVQAKQMIGGGNLTLHRSDATSKTAYGYRTLVVPMRNSKDADDAVRYGDSLVARRKDPRQIVDIVVPAFSKFVFPRGKVRVTDTNGAEFHYPIQRVSYKVDAVAGLVGSMEIGDAPAPKVEEQFADIIRRIEIVRSGSVSLTRIEHTRGEQFAQDAIVDARKNGKLNIFTDVLSDIKSFDSIVSSHVQFRDNFLWGTFDYAKTIAESVSIPTGDTASDLRLHMLVDPNGRIKFNQDDDVAMFFESNNNNGDWRIVEDSFGLEQWRDAGPSPFLFYIHRKGLVPTGQTGFTLGPTYTSRMRIDYGKVGGAAARAAWIVFAYVDANDHVRVEYYNDASNVVFKLIKQVAGVDTTLETVTETKDTNYILECICDGADNVQIKTYSTAGTLIHSSGVYNVPTLGGDQRFALWKFFNATDNQVARIRWLELDKVDVAPATTPSIKLTAMASIDAGVHFGSEFVLSDHIDPTDLVTGLKTVHVALSLGGYTDTKQLRIKFHIWHPSRLYAWGVSY